MKFPWFFYREDEWKQVLYGSQILLEKADIQKLEFRNASITVKEFLYIRYRRALLVQEYLVKDIIAIDLLFENVKNRFYRADPAIIAL
jgi:hypothetical protein